MGHFGRRLEPYCAVKSIEMLWSKRRGYDASYPQALQEVAGQVQALRAQGYRRVAVMGQSFGGNAAMAYMAHVGDADAVVVLLRYFDPAGLGHMPGTAAAFKKPVPFLWVVGTADRMYALGEDYAYRKAPAHPDSKYLVVTAGHLDTPDVAAEQVLEWLRGLRP